MTEASGRSNHSGILDEFLNQPHGKRGWLKNGNPPGDLSKAQRCGAKARRTQNSCRAPAMANGRCQFHGGKSTGPITPEGLAKSKIANWKTGRYSAEAKARKREVSDFSAMVRTVRELVGSTYKRLRRV